MTTDTELEGLGSRVVDLRPSDCNDLLAMASLPFVVPHRPEGFS